MLTDAWVRISADTCPLAADQPQSLSVIRLGVPACDRIAEYVLADLSGLGVLARYRSSSSA